MHMVLRTGLFKPHCLGFASAAGRGNSLWIAKCGINKWCALRAKRPRRQVVKVMSVMMSSFYRCSLWPENTNLMRKTSGFLLDKGRIPWTHHNGTKSMYFPNSVRVPSLIQNNNNRNCMMLQHRVPRVPLTDKKDNDLLPFSTERRLKCKSHWLKFKCVSSKNRWDLKAETNPHFNILDGAHFSRGDTFNVILIHLWPEQLLARREDFSWRSVWTPKYMSGTKIAEWAERCAFFVRLIIIWWAYWFDVGTVLGVFEWASVCVCVCISLHACAYIGAVH